MKRAVAFILAAVLFAALCPFAAAEAPDIIRKGKTGMEKHGMPAQEPSALPEMPEATEIPAAEEAQGTVFPEFVPPEGYERIKLEDEGAIQRAYYKNADGKTIVCAMEYTAAGEDVRGGSNRVYVYASGAVSGMPVMLRFTAEGGVRYALISIDDFDISITANEGVTLEEMEKMLASLVQ